MSDKNAIVEFQKLEDLEIAIEQDLKDNRTSINRYPVRFIFLNSHDELKKIVDLLSPDAKKYELSSFLYSDKGWLSEDQIIKEIKNINETAVILPVSEFIRFSEDIPFNKLLGSLAEIENYDIKLYIPLVGLWERFEELFWKSFYRKTEWAPIWRLSTPPKYINIYQVNFEFNDKIKTAGLELVSNSKEWFELWKKDDIDNIISLPKPLSVFFKNSLPDQTFTQQILNNPKEYLYHIFGMDVAIEYNSNEKEFWDNLLIDVSNLNKKNISLKDVFVEKFNINNINNLNLVDYLDFYLKNNNYPYKQWLIKNFFIESDVFEDSYLKCCFKSIQKLGNKNLARKIFLEIFRLNYSIKYLEERRGLLKCLIKHNVVIPENDFEAQFKNIDDLNYKQKLTYLTSNTSIEKEKIISIVKEKGIKNTISEIELIFPELYHYLDWNLSFDNCPNWIISYFNEYNQSKVINSKSLMIDTLLSENNNPSSFFNWYFEIDNIFKQIKNDSHVVWVDALGAEWLPLLTYYLNEFGKNNNKRVSYSAINSVYFPTSTKFNKHDDCNLKIGDLDKYIHDNTYNYPNSLLNEMDLIKKIAKQIVAIDSSKITIFSDHGFSFLCTGQAGCTKKHDFANAKHEGRYLPVENDVYEDTEDYICAETESRFFDKEKFLVTLKHVSLYKAAAHEVHGGVTPEEVLVPYIILENMDDSVIEYDVSCSKYDINVSKEKELPIQIYPKPSGLFTAFCKTEKLDISKNDDNYIIHLKPNLEKGKQKIILKVGNEKVKDLVINIKKGGFESNDDWF